VRGTEAAMDSALSILVEESWRMLSLLPRVVVHVMLT
jgi:hypothetical protein